MVPDMYTQEKLAMGKRQQLQREAAVEQALGEVPDHSSHALRHLVGNWARA
jgi:hypothetical protein